MLPGAAIRPVVLGLQPRNSPGGKPGMARVFAVWLRVLLGAGVIGVQIRTKARITPRLLSLWFALAQCRGREYVECINLSSCRAYKNGSGAHPGLGSLQNSLACRS